MTADSVKRWHGHEGVGQQFSPQPSNNPTEVLEAAVRLANRYIPADSCGGFCCLLSLGRAPRDYIFGFERKCGSPEHPRGQVKYQG